MKINYSVSALQELIEIINAYKSIQPGLGYVFYSDLERQVVQICRLPQIGTLIAGNCYRSSMIRFSYSIIYRYLRGEIQIIAVTQETKNPAYTPGMARSADSVADVAVRYAA